MGYQPVAEIHPLMTGAAGGSPAMSAQARSEGALTLNLAWRWDWLAYARSAGGPPALPGDACAPSTRSKLAIPDPPILTILVFEV